MLLINPRAAALAVRHGLPLHLIISHGRPLLTLIHKANTRVDPKKNPRPAQASASPIPHGSGPVGHRRAFSFFRNPWITEYNSVELSRRKLASASLAATTN